MKTKTIEEMKNLIRGINGLSNISLYYIKKEDKDMTEVSLDALSREMIKMQEYIAWYARSVSNTIDLDISDTLKDLQDEELI